MHKRTNSEFLLDIKEGIKRIESYTKNTDYKKFLRDVKTQDAVIRNFEIIGEAVKNISSDLKKARADIEWKKIAGLRDKIIHYYFGVNWDIVWAIIQDNLPQLKRKINAVIKKIFLKKD